MSATPMEITGQKYQHTNEFFIVAGVGNNGLEKISPHTLYGCRVWETMIQLMQLITPYRKNNKYGTITNE